MYVLPSYLSVDMAPTIQELGIDRLSLEDRVSVAKAILDNVMNELESTVVPPTQSAELERRLSGGR